MNIKTTLRNLFAAHVLAAFAAAPAQADEGDYQIQSISPNSIVVLSNGQDYTQLQGNSPAIIEAHVYLDVGVSGSIVSWWVEPEIWTGVGIATEVGGMWFSRHSESYPFGNRPNTVNKSVDLSVAAGTIEDEAVSMCNTIAAGLRHNGASNAQIFGQDRQAHFEVNLAHYQNLNGPGSNQLIFEAQDTVKLDVICKRHQPPATPGGSGGIAPRVDVLGSSLGLTEITTKTGTCQVRTSLQVQASVPNTQINYRYVHNGVPSQTYGAITDANGNFNVLRLWDIPKVPGTEVGWFEVEGVSATFKTNQSAYEMECQHTLGINSGNNDTPGRDVISR